VSTDERMRRMADGGAAFNRGEFFLAHELWEDVWRSAPPSERKWIQGLIQVAAGLHHLAGGRAGPSARLLARALAKLGDAPARLDGVDVASARVGTERILAALRQGEAVDPRSVVLS
jgi:predicted metal-dependent hydrolase